MKTKHLDNEIERLNLMERTKDLSEYGQDMLNEFRAIKQALTIPVVIESALDAFDRGFTRGYNTGVESGLAAD
jgi:hypothetical protein